jgi:mercuric reductase
MTASPQLGAAQGADRRMSYDLVVIGSGGAAFSAAIAARRKNKTVAMIERGNIGGTCVNTGCVPSKALLAAAEARHIAGHHPFPGIRTDAGPVDFPALITGTRALVEQIRADKYIELAAHHGWQITRGIARFVAGPILDVALPGGGSRQIEADHYVIATGSTPYAPLIPGLAEAGYLTSTSAMELEELPDSLIVLGGGYVGLELAQLFARLGAQVTVVEMLDRLAPTEEPETSRLIEDVFVDEGIQVRTRVTVTSVHRAEGTVFITLCHPDGTPEQLRAQHVLVATGRRAITDDLNLAAVGVKTGGRGEVLVDAHEHPPPPDLGGRRRHRPPPVRLRRRRARRINRRQCLRQRRPRAGLPAPTPGDLHRPASRLSRAHRRAGDPAWSGLHVPRPARRLPAQSPGQPRHPGPSQDRR